MKNLILSLGAVVLLGCQSSGTGDAPASRTSGAAPARDGFVSLFNGRDLAGWDGNTNLWSVRDGVIHGETSRENPIKQNTFLVWTNGVVEDFELRLSYRIVAGNSGIQYRSKIHDPKNWVVGGYQADFEAGKTYSGILYEERGPRGIMAQRGEKVSWNADGKKQVLGATEKTSAELQAAIKPEEWNDYVVVVKGNSFKHMINGNTTCEVTDDDVAKRAMSGVLALQIHTGPPMVVEFKNIRYRKL